MVVRDLAVDVMSDVSLRNSVSSECADPSHDRAEITEKLTIHSGQSTTREGELGSTVVREQRIGVLKEGDQYKPVINPETKELDNGARISKINVTKGKG